MRRARLPEESRLQCPACGVPVATVELRVQQVHGDGYGLLLEDCGHVVTIDAMRAVWGLDINEPNIMAVSYPKRD